MKFRSQGSIQSSSSQEGIQIATTFKMAGIHTLQIEVIIKKFLKRSCRKILEQLAVERKI
jgi:hypothetical protein